MPQLKVPTIALDGTRSFTSPKQAVKYLKRGMAHWDGECLVFGAKSHSPIEETPELTSHHWGPSLDIIAQPVDITDSGQSGFLRYPLPWGPNSHPDFIALSREGAGL